MPSAAARSNPTILRRRSHSQTGIGSALPNDVILIRALAVLVAYARVHTGGQYPADVIGAALAHGNIRTLAVRGCSRRVTMVQSEPRSLS